MNKCLHRAYWTEVGEDGESVKSRDFDDVVAFTKFTSELYRRKDVCLVATAIKMDNLVGEMGSDGVIDGNLPNGDKYGWRKRRP